MQIAPYEIADCWSEEDILKYFQKLNGEIEVFNQAVELKIKRLENLKFRQISLRENEANNK